MASTEYYVNLRAKTSLYAASAVDISQEFKIDTTNAPVTVVAEATIKSL